MWNLISNPEDRFSHVVAQIIWQLFAIEIMCQIKKNGNTGVLREDN